MARWNDHDRCGHPQCAFYARYALGMDSSYGQSHDCCGGHGCLGKRSVCWACGKRIAADAGHECDFLGEF